MALASRQAAVNHRVSYSAHRQLSTGQHGAGAAKDTPATADAENQAGHQEAQAKTAQAKKTMEQMDEELRLKLEGLSGDGGASGVEYENGKASGLKRNVKANMFRIMPQPSSRRS